MSNVADELRDNAGRWIITSTPHDTAASIVHSVGDRKGAAGIDHINRGKGLSTQDAHTDRKGLYTPERERLHQHIINHFLGGTVAQASPQALFTAGGAASGKSALAGRASDSAANMSTPRGHVYVNPDDIKAMLPETQALKDAGRGELAAAATHDESSDIAKMLTAIAVKRKRHMVIDGTGNSEVGKFGNKILAAKAAGYAVHVRYAHIPVETAIERERLRAKRTGRKVDESVLRHQHAVVARSFAEDVQHIPGVHVEILSTLGRGRPTPIAEIKPGKAIRVTNAKQYKELLDKAKATS